MDDAEFFRRLEFPEIWSVEGLYPDELRSEQERLLKDEEPGKVCGSEHYRYGVFIYYVKHPETKEALLSSLIDAAVSDPDDAMAQAAIIDLVSHPNSTEEIYKKAKEAISGFDEQYFDEALLDRAFRENIPSWKV